MSVVKGIRVDAFYVHTFLLAAEYIVYTIFRSNKTLHSDQAIVKGIQAFDITIKTFKMWKQAIEFNTKNKSRIKFDNNFCYHD